jgi:excisionase family DNA binding protein
MSTQRGHVESSSADRNAEDLTNLYAGIRSSGAKVVGADGNSVDLPLDLDGFLKRVSDCLRAGASVTLTKADVELTTAEAAQMLNVSRQFFVQLLESGQIPFHKVGTHRRVYLRDLLAFKSNRDSQRRSALHDIAKAEFEDGLYDLVPLRDAHAR